MPGGLRIGVNALYLIPGGVGGTEIYLRSLLQAMSELGSPHEFFVFSNCETGEDLIPLHERWHWRPLPVCGESRPARLLYEQIRLPSVCRRESVDVLFNPGFTAPYFPACPQVTVFHDLQHKRHPENFRWFDLPAWQFFLWIAARRSSHLVAVSEQTSRDLLHYYALPTERVSTIWSGVDETFFALQCGPEQKGEVLLCASTTHPHKNHERLLRVFSRLRGRLPGWKLMLTGVRGFADERVQALMRELQLEHDVIFTGWVSRAELYQLFRQASAFVYPSLFEGFGMPVLESMAAGIPTACSDIEPLRTLAGDAAELFVPEDETAMERALLRVMLDEGVRAKLSAAGPAQARRYTWRSAARQTIAVLERSAVQRK